MKKSSVIKSILIILFFSVVLLSALAGILSVLLFKPFVEILTDKVLYIAWAGCVVVTVIIFLANIKVRSSKRVLSLNVDLENSHFLTEQEISKNEGFTLTTMEHLNQVSDGIPIFAEKRHKTIDIILRQPIHTLVIGATGTGKTAAFVSPTIEILARTKSKPSMVITDPKGELYVRHKKTLIDNGYDVHLIDLSDVYHSTRWNPFNDVLRKTKIMKSKVEILHGKYIYNNRTFLTNAEAEKNRRENYVRLRDEIYIDLQDLIYTACPVDNKNDATWQRGARDLLFALALAFWEDVVDGYMDSNKFNFYNLYRNITDYAKGECEELKAYFETREPTSRTRGLSNTVLVSQDRTLSSYLGDVNQYLSWMADSGIAALTSGNEIEFSEFDEKPNALFLKIPDEKDNRHKLITLFITQMYKALIEKATMNQELNKTDSQKLLRNVYFIMDEFGNIPKLYKMDGIVTVGRSRGIFMIPVIQDFNQLDFKYGKEVAATIRSNCNIQIFIGSNDENTRKIFSAACGNKKSKQISFSDNKDQTVSTSAKSVPLIYPAELEHLNDPVNGIIGNSIVLCLGTYPLRGKVTPIYKALDIYKTSSSQLEKQQFISFKEKLTHYDINKVTQFLNTEKQLLDIGDNVNNDSENNKDYEIQQTNENIQSMENFANKDMNIVSEKQNQRNIKELILKRFSILKGKISQSDFLELCNADAIRQIFILNNLSSQFASQGNIILSAELENIKSFCLYSNFKDKEVNVIENYLSDIVNRRII